MSCGSQGVGGSGEPVPCPECGKYVPRGAQACPGCGCPIEPDDAGPRPGEGAEHPSPGQAGASSAGTSPSRRIGIGLLLAIAATALARYACRESRPQGPQAARKARAVASYNRGVERENQGRTDEAIQDYTDAINADPTLREAYFNRGLAYYAKGDHDAAIRDYTAAINGGLRLRDAHFNRGLAYDAKGDADAAIRDFTEVTRLDPRDAEAYQQRACVYSRKGEFDKAIADHAVRIQLEPAKAAAYADRGAAYLLGGEPAKAITDFTAAIRLDPKNAMPHSLRAEAHCVLGQRQQAIADYNEAIRLLEATPGGAPKKEVSVAYNDRGYTYWEMRDYDRATADCSKAIELDPNFALAYNNRAIAFIAKGLHDRAIADCDQAIRLDPNDDRGFTNRGRAFLEKRLHEKAFADLSEAIRLNPRNLDAWHGRSDARLHKGDYDGALADCDQILRLDPKHGGALLHRFIATTSAKLKQRGGLRRDRPTPTTSKQTETARQPRREGEEPAPPSPRRVVARANVLAAVVYRSVLEHYAENKEANALCDRLLEWLDALGLTSELEDQEAELLETAIGRAKPRTTIDGSWRAEGLAVLAWALKRFELRPHDESVADLLAAANAVGFLDDAAATRLLASAELRPPGEIGAFANQITLVSWRLTNFRIGAKGVGFADLQKLPAYCVIESWLKGLRLVDGDLAIGGKSLAAASDAERQTCNSIARERHVAAYWLQGDDETYSLISADTRVISRALAESQRGDPDVAIRVCSKILESASKEAAGEAVWLAHRGWAHLRKGDPAKGLADLNRAIELKPDASHYGRRAWAFFHSGDLASAEADARKAMTLEPKDPGPRVVLFRIETARGHGDEATKQARQLLKDSPTDSPAKAAHLVLRYFLGEVPLDTLRKHPQWFGFEVEVRGWRGAEPKP